MNTQPEALRWVNLLEYEATARGLTDYKHKAAAELRRLHQSEREGWRYADELEQERKRLHELNQELVEALTAATRAHELGVIVPREGIKMFQTVIAKASGTATQTGETE